MEALFLSPPQTTLYFALFPPLPHLLAHPLPFVFLLLPFFNPVILSSLSVLISFLYLLFIPLHNRAVIGLHGNWG